MAPPEIQRRPLTGRFATAGTCVPAASPRTVARMASGCCAPVMRVSTPLRAASSAARSFDRIPPRPDPPTCVRISCSRLASSTGIVGPALAVVHAVDVGQQQELVGADHHGDARRDGVVVGSARVGRIVAVHDRDDAAVQGLADHLRDAEHLRCGAQVGVADEDLAGERSGDAGDGSVEVHQERLPHGGRQPVRDLALALAGQQSRAGRHRPRRHDHDAPAELLRTQGVVQRAREDGRVRPALARDRTRAELGDQDLVCCRRSHRHHLGSGRRSVHHAGHGTDRRSWTIQSVGTGRRAGLGARRAGQGEAFGRIFDRHRDRVFRHGLRLVEGVSDADDLVAITFLEAWRRRDDLRVVDGRCCHGCS